MAHIAGTSGAGPRRAVLAGIRLAADSGFDRSMRELEGLALEVIDRTTLILNIFAERAKTGEATMQVDYAKLRYMLPRLIGLRSNLSRQGGTSGSMSNKGAGEKKIKPNPNPLNQILRPNATEIAKNLLQRRSNKCPSLS